MNEIIIRALEHERDNLLKEAGAVREKCAAIGDQIKMYKTLLGGREGD